MLFARWGLFFTKQRRRRYAYFQKTLHFSLFTPILIVMLSRRILLPRYKNSFSKAQTTAFKNSLLKIGGVDARSLVEIKRRRIGYTLSIFSRGMVAAGYIRCDVSAVSETHSQNYTRMYSFDDATTQIPAYFQKVVDTHSFVGIIPQQLSNSATQQLSNSATKQLSPSAPQQLERH